VPAGSGWPLCLENSGDLVGKIDCRSNVLAKVEPERF
jgi:hypothetical protein